MIDRRLFVWLLSVSVIGSAGAALARGGGDDNRGQVEGTLTAVATNTTPNTVTIDKVTLKVGAATEVEINGQHASLNDLEIGAFTEAKYDKGTFVATKIEQGQDDNGEDEDATVNGRVTSANADAGTVSLDLDQDAVADLTVTVNANTEIEIGSNHITASQIGLLNGLDARVEYFTGTLIAKEIHAQAGQPTNISGTVTAVNADERTIGIDTGDGVALVNVPKDAKITANGKKVKLQSIREGARITAKTVTNGSGDLIALKLTVKGRSRR